MTRTIVIRQEEGELSMPPRPTLAEYNRGQADGQQAEHRRWREGAEKAKAEIDAVYCKGNVSLSAQRASWMKKGIDALVAGVESELF